MKAVDKISKAIEHAKKELGYSLVSEDWGNEKEKCACALGCLLVSNKVKLGSMNEESVIELLDVSQHWVEAFISGFDETPWKLSIRFTTEQLDAMDEKEVAAIELAYKDGLALKNKFKPVVYSDWTADKNETVS